MTELINSLLLDSVPGLWIWRGELVIAPSKGPVFFFYFFYVITPDMQYFKGRLPPTFSVHLKKL